MRPGPWARQQDGLCTQTQLNKHTQLLRVPEHTDEHAITAPDVRAEHQSLSSPHGDGPPSSGRGPQVAVFTSTLIGRKGGEATQTPGRCCIVCQGPQGSADPETELWDGKGWQQCASCSSPSVYCLRVSSQGSVTRHKRVPTPQGCPIHRAPLLLRSLAPRAGLPCTVGRASPGGLGCPHCYAQPTRRCTLTAK